MRVIVVDDEDLAREALVSLLSGIKAINIVAECNNGLDAIKHIRELNPDLLFLDIKMPGINGFEVLEVLGKEAPPTIFVTAFDEFAIKAFEANAIDYLLKPVNPERLKKSLAHLQSLANFNPGKVENVIHAWQSNQTIQRILVRDGNKVHIIAVKDILWLEAQDDYVAIKTKKDNFLKLDRLSRLEELLNPQKFKRIHRSYIINMDYLDRVENQNTAILKTGQTLPVSRAGYTRVFK